MKRLALVTVINICMIIGQAAGLEVDVSSSNGRYSTDMSTDYGAAINDYVVHDIALNPLEGGLSNHHIGTGSVSKSITVIDARTRARATSYVSARGSGSYAWDLSSVPILGVIQTRGWLSARGYNSISGYSKAYNGNNLAQSSVSVSSATGLASLDYYTTAFEDASGGLHSAQMAYPGAAVKDNRYSFVSKQPYGASGDRVIFTETSSEDSGVCAASQLDADDAHVPYYSGKADTKTGVQTESWSKTTAGVTHLSSGRINAYSQALEGYMKSTGSYSDLVTSSATLTGTSILDYHTKATSDTNGLHSEQQAKPGASTITGWSQGAYGDRLTFKEISYDHQKDYDISYLNADEAHINYYSGCADTDAMIGEESAHTESRSQSYNAGGVSAYSKAFVGYVKASGLTPSSYGVLAQSSVAVNPGTGPSGAVLDYHTSANSSVVVAATSQQAYQGASAQPSVTGYGATGRSLSFAESSSNSNNYYASSYLDARSSSSDAQVISYKGNTQTTYNNASVSSLPQGINSDSYINYQTSANDSHGRYAKEYASTTASGLKNAILFENTEGTASAQNSGVKAAFNGLSLNGDEVSVMSDESDGANRYYIQSAASGPGYISGLNPFEGSTSSITGVGSVQNIFTLTGTSISINDYRKKGDNIQRVTLYPMTQPFSGTLISQDNGHIIQDGINTLATSGGNVSVAAGNYSDKLDQSYYSKDILLLAAPSTTPGTPGVIVNSITLNQPAKGTGKDFKNMAAKSVNVLNSSVTIQKGINLVINGGTVNVSSGTYNEDVVIDKSLTINGTGASNTIVNGMKNGSVFTINSSNIFVTLSGMKITGGSGTPLSGLLVGGGIFNKGTTTLKDCTISGDTADNGGGVYNYGAFTMNSGNITGNIARNGGGVYNYGFFSMNGGDINGNKALNGDGGGGVYNYLGNFYMNGGNINKNFAQGNYGGGGIYNDRGGIFMTGGNICNNSARYGSGSDYGAGAGVFNGGYFKLDGGNITGNGDFYINNGGGILNGYRYWSGHTAIYPTLYMTGGNINGNTAINGGGVSGLDLNDRFYMLGGNISGNSAYYGGGVYANWFSMDGGSITGNKALYRGGGVYITGWFFLNGGTISNNRAEQYGGGVGGVNWSPYSGWNFFMNGGTITGNSAGISGGGVDRVLGPYSGIIAGNTPNDMT